MAIFNINDVRIKLILMCGTCNDNEEQLIIDMVVVLMCISCNGINVYYVIVLAC